MFTLRESVHQCAAQYQFIRRGRRFYKLNNNADIVQAWFRPIPTDGNYELGLHMRGSLLQRVFRQIRYGQVHTLPLEFSESGQWTWSPPVPVEHRYLGARDVWRDVTAPGVEDAIKELAHDSWFPTLDKVISPGFATMLLKDPSVEIPGKVERSEVNLALSRLNDGDFTEHSMGQLLSVVVNGRPIIAERVLDLFGRTNL